MIRIFLLLCCLASSLLANAQEEGSFVITLSTDTVLMGNQLKLTYDIENLEGQFIAPDLSDFRVISGPNVSSQFSSINGRTSQKSSYSYYLVPLAPGVAKIGAALLKNEKRDIPLDESTIVVIDNPYGIIESYDTPFTRRSSIEQDSLTAAQKTLLNKLKKGKTRKI